MEIIHYKNDLELKYYKCRNKDRFVCGCGKVVVKECSVPHFRTRFHTNNNVDFFTTTQVSPSIIPY